MEELYKTTKSDIYKVDPRNIVVMEGFNSRSNFGNLDELAEQIKEQGVLNPISVIPFKDENNVEKYKLIDGERRYRAVMKLIDSGVEIARIPTLFLSKSASEEELLIQQALRNEGKPFNPYEWAVLAKKLMDKSGLTKTEVAKKLGKNPGTICRYLGYLELDPKLLALLRDDIVSGPNLDRVLKANNGNQEKAYNDLVGLKAKAEEKGTKKVSLRDCSLDSVTTIYKDTTTIRNGLETLVKYLDKYNKNKESKIKINIVHYILQELNDNKAIMQVFDDLKEISAKKAE